MTDPLEELPSELIVPALSSLSTPQRSLLTGVCRDWRIALHSNAILNRVIDLINISRPLEEMVMMAVVQSLCSLSTHPRSELLLDITHFWNNFCTLASKHNVRSEEIMSKKPNGFYSLLSAIAVETQGKLDKLFLHAGSSRRFTTNKDAFARTIVHGWDQLVAMVEGLRELHLQVPSSAISVRSRAPGEGGKACSIGSDLGPSKSKGSWQVSECNVFLEKVVAFTGAKITHLGICTGSFDSVVQLYKMVLLHKDSLNYLKLKVESSSRPELALQWQSDARIFRQLYSASARTKTLINLSRVWLWLSLKVHLLLSLESSNLTLKDLASTFHPIHSYIG